MRWLRRQKPLTCQENHDPWPLSQIRSAWMFSKLGHMHECVREQGHRSCVHRCHCGMEWWLLAGTDGVAPPSGDEINKAAS